MPENTELKEEFYRLCTEYLKGCSCSYKDKPYKCPDCTKGFLKALVDIAKEHNLAELNSKVIL